MIRLVRPSVQYQKSFLAELHEFDRDLLRLLRTQLERDWRKPLIKFLDQLLKKYV